MKKLLIFALLLNAALLAGRLWQDLTANAQVGGDECQDAPFHRFYSIDSNGDGNLNLSDPVHVLTWLFSGGPEPQVCLAQTSLESRVEALEAALTDDMQELLNHMNIVQLDDGGGGTAKTIRFTGVNVQIVNGLGATNGFPDDSASVDPAQTTTNGLGNLIVGYNELIGPGDRTGSHNMVVGVGHSYSSLGGLVVGFENTISGHYSSVTGGRSNEASGELSSVSGGEGNVARGARSSVGGGGRNEARGERSSISGGVENKAFGILSSVSGGGRNRALGARSSVSGGGGNEASGEESTVSGGRDNQAIANLATVSGGQGELAITGSGHVP